MKIAIIGTGGVGGYFGGRLLQSGNDVSFLARGKHLKNIQVSGLSIKSIKGDFVVNPKIATDRIEELGKSDLIIIALKTWQVKDIATKLNRIIHDDTIVLPLQNGILTSDELKEFIPEKHILGGLCRIFSKIESPGIIHHFGYEPSIVFGELNSLKTARMTRIKEVFDKSGIDSRISLDIKADLWKKFIPICIGGLMAVSETTYGELRSIPETRKLMEELLLEIFELSKAAEIDLESSLVEKTLKAIDSFPPDSTPSLARDVWQGKPSEIEYQNGTVVKLGKKYGIPTPVNRFVYSCILPGEIKARKKAIADTGF